jgi:hypothetical protein
MLMTLPRLLGLIVFAAVGLSLRAAQPPPKQKDPQSTFEPRSEPGSGQKFLARFVGAWDVVKTFYPRSGAPTRSKGECRQTMIHAGRFLQSEFVFHGASGKTTGLGITGFEPATGTFTSVWTDSRQTKMSLRQSRERFNGTEIVLYSGTLGGGGKESRSSRTVTRLEEDGRKIVHRQYTAGADGKERIIMELLLTRKADATRRP